MLQFYISTTIKIDYARASNKAEVYYYCTVGHLLADRQSFSVRENEKRNMAGKQRWVPLESNPKVRTHTITCLMFEMQCRRLS